MSRETFTIAYDGFALRDGAMDVRLQVRATEPGSFQISFELIQNWRQTLQFFATPEASGATNLLTLVLGVPTVGTGLVWLTKKLKARQPDKAEKLAKNAVQITVGTETLVVSLDLMRLYQDVAVRIFFYRLGLTRDAANIRFLYSHTDVAEGSRHEQRTVPCVSSAI